MSLIDWLRKLGILRFGAEGAVYHNATERPASLQMNGVYNSQKDIVDLDPQDDEVDSSLETTPADAR
jgi:hypothetical protein